MNTNFKSYTFLLTTILVALFSTGCKGDVVQQVDPVYQPLTSDHNKVNVNLYMLSGDLVPLQQEDITSSILHIKELIAEIRNLDVSQISILCRSYKCPDEMQLMDLRNNLDDFIELTLVILSMSTDLKGLYQNPLGLLNDAIAARPDVVRNKRLYFHAFETCGYKAFLEFGRGGNPLREDRDFMLRLVRSHHIAFQVASREIKNDQEVVLAAVQQSFNSRKKTNAEPFHPLAFIELEENCLRSDLEFMKKGESSVENFFVIGDLQADAMNQVYTAWEQAVKAADKINARIIRLKFDK